MLALQPMLRATTLLTAAVMIAAAFTGTASAGLAIGAVMALANLFALAFLVGRFASSLRGGSAPAAGLVALQGKALMLPIAMIAVGSYVGFASVLLGYTVVATAFTLAVPYVALRATPLTVVESL